MELVLLFGTEAWVVEAILAVPSRRFLCLWKKFSASRCKRLDRTSAQWFNYSRAVIDTIIMINLFQLFMIIHRVQLSVNT
jgi:hypothetical protein